MHPLVGGVKWTLSSLVMFCCCTGYAFKIFALSTLTNHSKLLSKYHTIMRDYTSSRKHYNSVAVGWSSLTTSVGQVSGRCVALPAKMRVDPKTVALVAGVLFAGFKWPCRCSFRQSSEPAGFHD